MSLASIAGFAAEVLGDDVLDRIDRELRAGGDSGPRTHRSADGRREAPGTTGREETQEGPHEQP
ncbi:hypothetical protein [Streptomyces sp. NPDC056190]|uniref:hypothetical protein n=1 Tax=unclassified Streptomyces TaxID=2593676 RepID=UPI0035DF1927